MAKVSQTNGAASREQSQTCANLAELSLAEEEVKYTRLSFSCSRDKQCVFGGAVQTGGKRVFAEEAFKALFWLFCFLLFFLPLLTFESLE